MIRHRPAAGADASTSEEEIAQRLTGLVQLWIGNGSDAETSLTLHDLSTKDMQDLPDGNNVPKLHYSFFLSAHDIPEVQRGSITPGITTLKHEGGAPDQSVPALLAEVPRVYPLPLGCAFV